jgi:hypothetical protein
MFVEPSAFDGLDQVGILDGVKRDFLAHLKEDRAAINAVMVDYLERLESLAA